MERVPDIIRSDEDEGEGAGGVVLGTEVPGVGFKLLEPRLELGSRVVGEGLGGVDGLASRHCTLWDGWMEGWIDF
jgi:hypothetical protein